LLGLLGVCLLFTTIDRIPTIIFKDGRSALIGVVTTHAGVLILLAGYIYGETEGFRYSVKAIENEMTVVPGLPFVIQLDELIIEQYSEETFKHLNLARLPNKIHESRLSLYKYGKIWLTGSASPGNPLDAEGITILPSLNDTGWYFDIFVTNSEGVETRIPVRPWNPPLLELETRVVTIHNFSMGENSSFEILTVEDGQQRSLGFVSREKTLEVDGYSIALGDTKRYTGLIIYQRPQMPVFFLGFLFTLAGLIWHFYYRDRKVTR